MNQTIKNILGGAGAVAVLAFGYAAVSYVSSYGKSIQPSSFRSFSVTGDGKATAIPDVAEFSFQVITEGGKDLTSLQAKNTDAVNKTIAFIKSKGVEAKDITTQYYNVNPRYQTYDCRSTPIVYGAPSTGGTTATVQPCPPASIVGYTVTQSVDIKVRDFGKIGDIMGGVVTNGANQVGSLSFTIDDPEKVQGEARAEAITKAKAKAQAVAEAGGFKIGRLLGVQEGGYRMPMYDNYAGAEVMAAKSVAAPAPTIEPGSQEVSVSVTLQYEIE